MTWFVRWEEWWVGDLKHHLWGDNIHSALGCLLVAMTTPLLSGLRGYVRGCGDRFVAAFGSQSWGWRTPYPETGLSLLLWVKRENMTLPFWSYGLHGAQTYFSAGIWGIGKQKRRTGVLCFRGLEFVPTRASGSGHRPPLECWVAKQSWLVNSALPITGNFQNVPCFFLISIYLY